MGQRTATFRPLDGIVASLAWGATRSSLVARHPRARRIRDAADAEWWELDEPIVLAGIAWRAALELELGVLVAARLRPLGGVEALDGGAAAGLLAELATLCGAALERRDEGYYAVDGDTSRLTVDLLDGTLCLEDRDAR